MSRFKVLALMLVLVMAIMPLAVLAQDDQEYEEFESEDGLLTASVPVDWVTHVDDASPLPVLLMLNSEEGLDRILSDVDPGPDDQAVLVYIFPTDFFTFLGMSISDDMTSLETVEAISEVFFEPPLDEEGNVIEDEIVEMSEAEEIEISDDRTVGAVVVKDAATEGVFITFRPGEGLLALVFGVTMPGEFTDELNEITLAVAASVEYAGSADDMMMALMGGAFEEEPEAEALDGKQLIDSRCSMCHTTDQIYSADKDEAGWTATVDRMIGYGAALDDAERAAVIEYLVQNH